MGATTHANGKPFSLDELLARVRSILRRSRRADLLEFMMRHPGQALERGMLLAEVWGYGFLGGSNVIDGYVRYLRRKIESPGVPLLETRLTLPLARMFAGWASSSTLPAHG